MTAGINMSADAQSLLDGTTGTIHSPPIQMKLTLFTTAMLATMLPSLAFAWFVSIDPNPRSMIVDPVHVAHKLTRNQNCNLTNHNQVGGECIGSAADAGKRYACLRVIRMLESKSFDQASAFICDQPPPQGKRDRAENLFPSNPSC
jgi:hypothetical protein